MLTDARGKALVSRTVYFRTTCSQARGLMFRKPAAGTAYVFVFGRETRTSFHMLFVFWAIDLYLLDQNGVVSDMRRSFLPFTVYSPHASFYAAIETAPGLLSLKTGEKVRF